MPVNANKVIWGVASYQAQGPIASANDARLGVYLYSYGQSPEIDRAWLYNNETYYSNWIPVIYGHDYRFIYYCEYLTLPGQATGTLQMYLVTSS